MCFEQEVNVIVMLASEIENGKEKCYAYWPDDSALEFETLQVIRTSYEEVKLHSKFPVPFPP